MVTFSVGRRHFARSGRNDARGLRLEILLGKLAAQKMEIHSSARPTVCPITHQASEKDERIENLRILEARKSNSFGFVFLIVLNELRHGGIKRRSGLHSG